MKTFKTEKGTELPLMDIKGKPYLMVAHRLVWFNEKYPHWSIETELKAYAEYTDARAVIKDEVGRVRSTAHKRETVQGFSDHFEKAETGAIGRALAFIGIGTQFTNIELEEGSRLADSPIIPAIRKDFFAELHPMSQEGPPIDIRQSFLLGQLDIRQSRVEGPSDEDPPPIERSSYSPPSEIPFEAWDKELRITPANINEVVAMDAGSFVITFGKKYKGQKLRDIDKHELQSYFDWFKKKQDNGEKVYDDCRKFLEMAAIYLNE